MDAAIPALRQPNGPLAFSAASRTDVWPSRGDAALDVGFTASRFLDASLLAPPPQLAGAYAKLGEDLQGGSHDWGARQPAFGGSAPTIRASEQLWLRLKALQDRIEQETRIGNGNSNHQDAWQQQASRKPGPWPVSEARPAGWAAEHSRQHSSDTMTPRTRPLQQQHQQQPPLHHAPLMRAAGAQGPSELPSAAPARRDERVLPASQPAEGDAQGAISGLISALLRGKVNEADAKNELQALLASQAADRQQQPARQPRPQARPQQPPPPPHPQQQGQPHQQQAQPHTTMPVRLPPPRMTPGPSPFSAVAAAAAAEAPLLAGSAMPAWPTQERLAPGPAPADRTSCAVPVLDSPHAPRVGAALAVRPPLPAGVQTLLSGTDRAGSGGSPRQARPLGRAQAPPTPPLTSPPAPPQLLAVLQQLGARAGPDLTAASEQVNVQQGQAQQDALKVLQILQQLVGAGASAGHALDPSTPPSGPVNAHDQASQQHLPAPAGGAGGLSQAPQLSARQNSGESAEQRGLKRPAAWCDPAPTGVADRPAKRGALAPSMDATGRGGGAPPPLAAVLQEGSRDTPSVPSDSEEGTEQEQDEGALSPRARDALAGLLDLANGGAAPNAPEVPPSTSPFLAAHPGHQEGMAAPGYPLPGDHPRPNRPERLPLGYRRKSVQDRVYDYPEPLVAACKDHWAVNESVMVMYKGLSGMLRSRGGRFVVEWKPPGSDAAMITSVPELVRNGGEGNPKRWRALVRTPDFVRPGRYGRAGVPMTAEEFLAIVGC